MKIGLLFVLLLISLTACKAEEPSGEQNPKPKEQTSDISSTYPKRSASEETSTSQTVEDNKPGVFSKNNHEYSIDVVTGATTGQYSGSAYSGENKRERMFWSGRPELGEVIGDFYHYRLEFDGGYLATLDVVKQGDKIILVEFDEKSPSNYYSADWSNQSKRLSGYANFQAENSRTDITLVTVVNAMTFLESQMLEKNTLVGDFYSVKGASNSARHGYIPLAEKISKKVNRHSKEIYHGVTKELGKGLFGRLIVIKDKVSNKIVEVRYDEYFSDSKAEIEDTNLKEYYRQSKYESSLYSTNSGQNFKKLAEKLTKDIIGTQSLNIKIKDPSMEKNYSQLKDDMVALLTK